jgi:hypothetical protein
MSLVFDDELQESFKTAVLKHITNQLPDEEWVWLRAHADHQLMGLLPATVIDLALTPDQLLSKHVETDPAGAHELIATYPSEVVDRVAGHPLHFSRKTGLYFWSQSNHGGCLTLWISHPSARPGDFL